MQGYLLWPPDLPAASGGVCGANLALLPAYWDPSAGALPPTWRRLDTEHFCVLLVAVMASAKTPATPASQNGAELGAARMPLPPRARASIEQLESARARQQQLYAALRVMSAEGGHDRWVHSGIASALASADPRAVGADAAEAL